MIGPARGPVPAPSPELWADPTRHRVLQALAAQGRAVPIAEVVAAVGGHPNTTRGHLEALRAAGLVRRDAAPHVGRGRPPWLHSLTDVGRSVVRRLRTSQEAAGLGVDSLALAFVRYLAALPDPSVQAREVGRRWGSSLPRPSAARTRPGRRRALMDLLDRTGFTPVMARESSLSGPTDEIVLRSCPLLESAREHPEVVCQVHRGLVEGVLGRDGDGSDGRADVSVELDPWGRPEGCLLLLTWPQTVTDGRTVQAVDSAVAESEVQTATGVAAP